MNGNKQEKHYTSLEQKNLYGNKGGSLMVIYNGAKGNKSRVQQMAYKLGVSQKVAEQLIKAYCEDLEETLLCGIDVNIPGVFSIKVYGEGTDRVYRGRVSAALKSRMAEMGKKSYAVSVEGVE